MSLNGGENPDFFSKSLIITDQINLPANKEVKRISKNQLRVMNFWLGQRLYDNSDLSAFENEYSHFGRFRFNTMFGIPEIDEMGEDYSGLNEVGRDLAFELKKMAGPLVIFIVSTASVAEYSWFNRLPNNLKKYRKDIGFEDTFIYKVIMGGWWRNHELLPEDLTGHNFRRSELRAYELGSSYLTYNTDYPSVGSRRLVEYMNRLLGVDLQGENFPDYSLEDRVRMSWHINREDFNLFTPREGAIPKYQIINDKPQFAF